VGSDLTIGLALVDSQVLDALVVAVEVIAVEALNAYVVEGPVLLAVSHCSLEADVGIDSVMEVVAGLSEPELLRVSLKVVEVGQLADSKVKAVNALKAVKLLLGEFGNLVGFAIGDDLFAGKPVSRKQEARNALLTVVFIWSVERAVSDRLVCSEIAQVVVNVIVVDASLAYGFGPHSVVKQAVGNVLDN